MTDSFSFDGSFPAVRMRRLRYHPAVRRLIRSVSISPGSLVLPLFVRSGENIKNPIPSMPGQFQFSPDMVALEAAEAERLGLGGVILFGIPDSKDPVGSESLSPEGIIPRAIDAIKQKTDGLLIMTDLCFCEYTDHGQCGPVARFGGRTDVDNDSTLELLAKQAIVHAKAGADLIAPSGMMDGMIGAIRVGLDQAGFSHLPLLSYAAKYASSFYGPFRDAAESSPQSGDRKGYQMDFAVGAEQALREVALDLAEGADIVMVKPALAYLDIIRLVRERFAGVPLAAYQVSGEYSMVKAAAERGWLDERATVLESLCAIRRAGADIILTYWAKDVVRWLD